MSEARYAFSSYFTKPTSSNLPTQRTNYHTNSYHSSLEKTRLGTPLVRPHQFRQYPSVSSKIKEMEANAPPNINAMIEEGEVVPHQLVVLLTDEQRNLKNFKARIEKEKTRVIADFEVFKKEINHVIDDLKLSVAAELDTLYKTYIEKYAYMKSQIMEIRRVKKQIHSQNVGQSQISKLMVNPYETSNLDLVKDLEEEVKNMRSYKITNFLNELHKKKLSPLNVLAKDLVIMTSTCAEFYDSNKCTSQLAEIKQNFGHFTKHMFEALGEYVKSPLNRLELAKGISEPVLKGIEFSKITEKPVTANTPKKMIRKEFSISQSQQILCTDWAEDVTLKHFNSIRPGHEQMVLCALVIQNKYLVSGGKDGQLIVQTLSGQRVAGLRGHQSSICTLALIEDKATIYLASGSDHGCNSIIIWDIQTWSIKAKIKAHTAAVTSIVDLCDGQTLVSGSYDKKINVYNYKKSALLFSLPNNKSSVTSMLLNSARNKLISCGFDSMMFVWNIIRDQTGIVEAISIERVIQNNSIICCLSGSMLRAETIIAGTKDGKIKFWNINTGQIQKTLTVNNNLIMDMVLIQRQSRPNFPIILSCSSKDRSLVLTRTDTGTNSVADVGGRNYIEFGCGIGPKMIFAKFESTPVLGLVSQSPESKEVNMFQIEFK